MGEPWTWDDVRDGWERAVGDVALQPLGSVTARFAPRRSWLRAPDAAVLLAGAGGSGKSCMIKALAGVDPSGADPPGRSSDVEVHRLDFTTLRGTRRVHLHVPPGQASDVRDVELDRLLSDGFYPSGVIYTVGFGYDTFWGREAVAYAAQTRATGGHLDLTTLRRRKMGDENRTFERVCRLLGNAWNRADAPVWLILAVTKSDLFFDRIDDARDHYIPGGAAPADEETEEKVEEEVDGQEVDEEIAALSREFTYHLESLVTQVGVQRLRIDVVPFSCMQENYAFGTELTERPKMDAAESRALYRHFMSVLGGQL